MTRMLASRCGALISLLPISLAAGAEGQSQGPPAVRFVDEAAEVGVSLVNVSGTSNKRHIVESTGAGACFLDFDLDGDLDLYLVNGATLATQGPANPARDALYENDGRGRLVDTTATAGLGDPGWGGGCAVADYDNDGDPDLYLTHYGADALYRNRGDGTFEEATAAAGLGDPRWSLGAVFFDADRDGDLDLYVANYLRFDPAEPWVLEQRCRWKGGEVMCGPRGFTGQADVFYVNEGNGTFREASAAAGVGGDELYGMGVVAGDLDGDGRQEVFVANDSQANSLWVAEGLWAAGAGGRFQDHALLAGVAFSGDGRQQAGMGADLGDYDGDGDEDLFVTNFSDDYHTLYRNDGELLFTDVSAEAGLDPATRSSLGWGGGFFDYDNDGDLDLLVASGHVYPGVEKFDPATSYRQRNLLLENDGGGRFREVGTRSGPGLAALHLGRGAAFGDYDDDGDIDVAVVNDGEPPSLLRNDGGNARPWIKLRLRGTGSNRDGIGARVRLTAGGRSQFRELRLNGGYLSSHDPRLHFGLGEAGVADQIQVRWPSGIEQTFTGLPAGHLVTIDEERGVVSTVRLAGWQRGEAAPPATASAAAAATASPASATPEPAAPHTGTGPSAELHAGSVPPGTPAAPVSAAPAGITPSAEAAAPRTAPPTAGSPPPSARRLSREDLRRIDGLVQAGTRYIQAGNLMQGVAAYEQALAMLPAWEAAAESPDALGFGDRETYRRFLSSLFDNLGVGLMRAERLTECAEAIGSALAIEPGRAKLHYNLGLCHFHGRRYAEAVASFQAAGAAGERSPSLSYDLGRALAAAGRCDEAVVSLGEAIAGLPRPELRGRDADAWYLIGGCHADAGRLPEAADDFREALSLEPGHQKALYKLALAWRRAGRAGAAEATERLFGARQPADESVRSAKRAGPSSRDERLRLARAYLVAGLPSQAVQEAQSALVEAPADAAALALLGQALVAFRPAALLPAREAFQRALKADASSAAALAGLGETLRLEGRGAEAAPLFERVLAASAPGAAAQVSDGASAVIAASIGLAKLAAAVGDWQGATSRLSKLVEEQPADPAVTLALAELYAAAPAGPRRRPREALELLARAPRWYGEGEEIRVSALALLGEREAARRVLGESPFLGPAEREALAALVE